MKNALTFPGREEWPAGRRQCRSALVLLDTSGDRGTQSGDDGLAGLDGQEKAAKRFQDPLPPTDVVHGQAPDP